MINELPDYFGVKRNSKSQESRHRKNMTMPTSVRGSNFRVT